MCYNIRNEFISYCMIYECEENMEVQRIEKQYINDLIELYNQLLPNFQTSYNDKVEELYNLIDKSDYYYIIVGIENEIAITTCSMIVIPNLTHGQRPYAIIENVITHKNYRKKGYGSQVINYAINLAKDKNCYKILLQTRRKEKGTLNFYKKLGFTDNMTTGFMLDFEKGK